ncbi:expressed unknown protein [Seminavis robusta]|uniref:Uncharacterized protein n=1 Tax=Seminavis robusta TaxID=568900 RepID=A0A9N8E5P8_9STRA|nr:expressed unknown protein [Seminavis robusta]|eukprot:Sro647_g180870.1 n/a (1284) ;mRNA; r:12815-16832
MDTAQEIQQPITMETNTMNAAGTRDDQSQQHDRMVEQFSSSLASIASSARQALHHQQSSASSDTSSSNNSKEAMVVTATGTEGTTTGTSANNSNTSANNSNSSSGSGSGGDDRDSGGDGQEGDNSNDQKKKPAANKPLSLGLPLPPHHGAAHTHSHHHNRRNKRVSTGGDDYGLPPLRVDDDTRWQASSHPAAAAGGGGGSHHATVVARLPPPDSSFSSSGNEGSNRGPAYHAIKQTLLQKSSSKSKSKKKKSKTGLTGPSKSSSSKKPANTIKTTSSSSSKKKKSKQQQQPEAMSSDSSRETTVVHHKRHHHGMKRPAASSPGSGSGNSPPGSKESSSQKNKKTKKLKTTTSSGGPEASASAAASASMARKKRPHQSQEEGQAVASSTMPTATEAEEDENYGSNSSSGSGTEAGYAGSASSNENLARKSGDPGSSSNSNSSSDMPDFSSGASESNAGYAFGSSNSPSLSSSNGEDDEDDDSSEDDGRRKAKSAAPSSSKSQWPHHVRQSSSTVPMDERKMPAKTSISTMTALASSTAQSQFAKVSRSSAGTTAETSTAVAIRAKARSSRRASRALSQNSNKPPILTLGSDLMAHVLTFLEPPNILRVLTMPLSKDWLSTFANQQELWRVLCLLEPFKAQVEENDFSTSSSSSSSASSAISSEDEVGEDPDDDGSLSSFSVVAPASASRKAWKGPAARAVRRDTPPTKVDTSTVAAVAKPLSSQKKKQVKLGKLGRYRLLYTSFVRCMKYLERMKEDVLHGRPPSMIEYGGSSLPSTVSRQAAIGSNRSLQQFLAGARRVVEQQQQPPEVALAANNNANRDEGSTLSEEEQPPAGAPLGVARMPILSADDGSNSYQSSVERPRKRKKSRDQKRRKRPKFGRSMLTDRLLAPARTGEVNPENVALPWSCALYSIVNWMVAFADVEGIQVMCLKVLPHLLEDEQQRITAQRVGLTDVILRGMVLFPNSVQLHTASFHTLVLLARPLGGREGMLFHSAMVNAAGIFSGGGEANNGNNAPVVAEEGNEDAEQEERMFSGGPQNDGKNGIAVMLDSMRKFEDDEALQAMSCWSLVNIALAPVQKEMLVKLGGIEVTTNAMMRHPHSAEVQFRALFALINLVIPSVNVRGEDENDQGNINEANDGIAEELNVMVDQITSLVVLAMKYFCSSEAILNRACLVLHNLSLTQAYHSTLLWTPNCYQMLEWCLANYRTDQVLQQSAAGTLHRLQVTLSNDENLRTRFAASIQAQQQLSLEAAHREALHIYEQQEQLRQGRDAAASNGGGAGAR